MNLCLKSSPTNHQLGNSLWCQKFATCLWTVLQGAALILYRPELENVTDPRANPFELNKFRIHPTVVIHLSNHSLKAPVHRPEDKLQPGIQIFSQRGNTALGMEYGWNLATTLSKILRKSIPDQNRKKKFFDFFRFFSRKISKISQLKL